LEYQEPELFKEPLEGSFGSEAFSESSTEDYVESDAEESDIVEESLGAEEKEMDTPIIDSDEMTAELWHARVREGLRRLTMG
jgi:hypothetical protein